MLQIKDICINDGRVPGLPKNPRFIKTHKFELLKKSLIEFPEMLELREIIVFPFEDGYVCIAGNMRLLASIELGHTEIPAKILPAEFPIEKLRELTIKDNASFGDDDIETLANEWSDFPLTDWGIEVPVIDEFSPNLEPTVSTRIISADDIIKTREELENKYKDSDYDTSEIICPHCLETFFLQLN